MSQLEKFSSRPKTGGSDLTPKCGACGLYKSCESPKMQPSGRGRSKILVIGDVPGGEDDKQGHPFSGTSGQFLRDVVGRAGVMFDDLRFTNSIICHPPGNKMPKGGAEVGWCRPNLQRTLDEFQPRVIITLGRHAMESVLQPYWRSEFKALERWVGAKIPLEKHWVCPTWHPSYLMREREPMMDRFFMEHLEAALSIDEEPPALPDFESKIELLFDEVDIVRVLRWFDEQGGSIAFDYETNCLKPEYPKARIYSCAISNGKRTVAYPWHGDAISETSRLLRSRTRKLAANMKFEERWTLKHLGHPVTNWDWDTMLATHAIDNRSGICSLKFQAFVLMGVPTYNDYYVEQYLKSGEGHYNRIHELDLKVLLKYNAMDALLEWHLARRQQTRFGGGMYRWRRPPPFGIYRNPPGYRRNECQRAISQSGYNAGGNSET